MTSPILITGTNKRVGLQLSERLAEAGFDVLAVNRSPAAGHHPRIAHFQADLRSTEERNALIAFVRNSYPSLRGIIHNASLWLDDDLDNLDTMFRIHVEAPFHLNRELGDLLRQSAKADIIHICDDSSSRGSKSHVAYAATKAALQNMTLSFAALYGPDVHVNAISPGLLIFKEDSTPEYQAKALNKAVLQYEPGAEPLIQAVFYLLESNYSTGSNIVINGGRHLRRN
ncbi:dihydromonapterin reductase [Zestomonas carbonaria]|uniref:Dihydromonapterin reductase n=1 Tax=Zestomonas carbonaria TaxID=2762745 RepID=A0A7U7EM00_9GAMM|nr:dihydromonapterin reductase [Pseudomonas carbonaria]CAD5107493.1 Dihydromonapterin reductase [Pseudomonas carbonaria]